MLMLVMHSECHVCSYLLCRLPSNYETHSINLAIMNAWNLLYSYLYVPQWCIAVSFKECTLWKSLWIKASAKCPQCSLILSVGGGGRGGEGGLALAAWLAHRGSVLPGGLAGEAGHVVDDRGEFGWAIELQLRQALLVGGHHAFDAWTLTHTRSVCIIQLYSIQHCGGNIGRRFPRGKDCWICAHE